MVIDAESALRAVTVVLENHEANRTAMGSLKSGVVTGIGTIIGSFLGGPQGTIPGALLGASIAYLTQKDSYKSILEVIQNNLSDREKEELARNVQRVIANFNVADVALLMNLAIENVTFQNDIVRCVSSYVDSRVAQHRTSNY